MTSYEDFVAGKRTAHIPTGLHVTRDLGPHLFPFQRDITMWALRTGRCAVFADTGLGKTRIELVWAREVAAAHEKPVLILAPLAVASQTVREGARIGVPVVYVRNADEVAASRSRIVITNYDRLASFDPTAFSGVVLDESSILKSYMGATKVRLLSAFAETPFRLCATATPAPNDHMELGNHSEFLGVLSSHQMLTRWFINDTMSFGSYRLKGHAVAAFWDWVTSWARCVGKPSDLGYSDEGYVLPELRIERHIVDVDMTAARKDGELFRVPEMSATSVHKEKRLSAPIRAERARELLAAEPDEAWVVWCETDYEAEAVRALVPELVEVRGKDSLEDKESRLTDFSEGRMRMLLTKPKIAGHGLNWQHCARCIFVGASYSYEAFYQTVRRFWRFGQTRPVVAHVILGTGELAVWDVLTRKKDEHEEMKAEMFAAGRRALEREDRSLRAYEPAVVATLPEWVAPGAEVRVVDFAAGEGWAVACGDSVEVMRQLPEACVDFAVYSPPFANLYTYSDSDRDMGNCANDAEFFAHYAFLLTELYRILRPGRLVSVHCKDLVNYAGRDGMAGLRDFPGAIIAAHLAAGFAYHSRVTIWKDPVIEMQRTKAHGLLYKQLRSDSTFSRQGLAEYVVTFRKWADDEGSGVAPVEHTHESFPLERWQRWASPVWDDVNQTRVLNVQSARDNGDEKHICPLQLDVVERCVSLWSNAGDVVFSPYAGIGSEGYGAIRMQSTGGGKRRFFGIELKPSYFAQSTRYLAEAANVEQGELFAGVV